MKLVDLLRYEALALYALAPLLSAGDIFALHRTSRVCRSACEHWRRSGILRGRVIEALAARGHGVGFLDALRQTNSGGSGALVSGSLVLCAIQGDPWQADDLDIYRTALPDRTDRFLPIEDYLWSHIGCSESGYSYDNYDDLGFFIVRTYHGPVDHRCQVMVLTDDDASSGGGGGGGGGGVSAVEQWIHSKYDLSFLANTFDGHRLVVHDTGAVSSRAAPYRPNTVDASSPCGLRALPCHFERAAKYATRGYRVTNMRTEETTVVDGDHVVPLTKVYLDDRFWTARLKREDIQAALLFPTPSRNNDGAGEFGAFDLDKAVTSYARRNGRDDQDCPDTILLSNLFHVIHSQISRTYHYAEHVWYQEQLNLRFGHLHCFNNVRVR